MAVEVLHTSAEPQEYKSNDFINRIVWLAAREVSRQQGINSTNPEFLLAALLAEGSIRYTLEAQDLTLGDVRLEFEKYVKNIPKPLAIGEPVVDPWDRITNRSRIILSTAYENASLEGREVSSLDILNRIYDDGDNYGYKILQGVKYQRSPEPSNPQE